jgi:NAD(P)H-hydrate epimerase
MALPLASTLSDSISIKAKHTIIEESKSSTVVGIGPGISRNAETGQLVWELLPNLENKIIILVGAAIDSIILGLELINQKAEPSYAKDWFANNDHLLVLLLSRSQAMKLYSKVVASTEDIPFEEMASVITEQLSCFCVITSDQTIITAKDKLFLDYNNNFPKDVLAGDILNVLFGNLCSILAQNPNKPEEAILSAVYLFNKATSTAHSEIKNRALAPSDIIRFIPPTIKEIEKNFE